MNADKTAATSSAIASMGGYGCAKYENTDEKKYSANGDTFISVIQAYEETVIGTVDSYWDAPTSVDDLVIPAGQCLHLKAKSVTIKSGYGVLYYEIAT